MEKLFKSVSENKEECFYIESIRPLTTEELLVLRQILADGFIQESVRHYSDFSSKENVLELGPRMNFATPYSTNLVSICHACGLKVVTRAEKSRRYNLPDGTDREIFVANHHDRMTECVYPEPLASFEIGINPEEVYEIPLKEKGPDALKIPGLAMDQWDREFYYNYFVKEEGRNPTIVEMQDLNNANSEHSRHGYFKGRQILDGEEQPETLLEIVKSTWQANNGNSLIAFSDNSSAIVGTMCQTIVPENPGQPSSFKKDAHLYHIIFTAETHNFPSGIAPVPGAETGTGGRIRDVQATGKGGLVIAGTAGYCVANLNLPGYYLPWEDRNFEIPSNMANGQQIAIGASNGASDYGNKFGEPVIAGFIRSYDLQLPNGRWAWIKPIMFTGGIGQIDHNHLYKEDPLAEMLIVQVGGPAYRIGVGGGSASSMIQGENEAKLDFNAVQRGDAEMEQKMNRVIRACIELGENNPIASIHDQGAGGPANVLKELVEKSGGEIQLRNIKVGDPTMSALEIWIAEYQERCGFLIYPEKLSFFQEVCSREKVNLEVLGKATSDGSFVVHDASNGGTPVDLNLNKVLGGMPQKTFSDERSNFNFPALNLPTDLTLDRALELVLKNSAVGSKGWLVRKVDRSVTGLIAQQQCCGPMHLPVSDVAVIAQSHFGLSGAATAIGEQPIKMILDPAEGARLAVAEAVTNLMWAKVGSLENVKCSANWMWAPKLPGEGAALYDAATAMRDYMIALGIAVDGGKDSLSMATLVGDELVKSPRELVISAYAHMMDITKVVTPDFKEVDSNILWVPLGASDGLAASALAQALDQIGSVSEMPKATDAQYLKSAFNVIQQFIKEGLILAGHDVSDGGLITAIIEMALAGNIGAYIDIAHEEDHISALFNEAPGVVLEVSDEKVSKVVATLEENDLYYEHLGHTSSKRRLEITTLNNLSWNMSLDSLRIWWESTSDQMEKQQANPEVVQMEVSSRVGAKNPIYKASFVPKASPVVSDEERKEYKVAILREEGSNGDREMTSAFYEAGFDVQDIVMEDLLSGKVDLADFRGLAAVGGFSYADVPESAKGWAATIKLNEKLNHMFTEFYDRENTFSLGVCNGCQLFALLGWSPGKYIAPKSQPRFVKNASQRFESRWSTVRINESPAIMLKGMAGSQLGVWVAHGEGRLHFPNKIIYDKVIEHKLQPLQYVHEGGPTMLYPYNPNGSIDGIAGLCNIDGRHLAMMPHPERSFLKWQWGYLPRELNDQWEASPWLKMFQNARSWCEHNE